MIGPVEVRGATAEVDTRERRPRDEGPVHLALAFETAQVPVELGSPLIHLAGKEAEAAPIWGGRQAVWRRDVEIQATWSVTEGLGPGGHDCWHRQVAVPPEERRGMSVEHAVAVAPVPMSFDICTGTELTLLAAGDGASSCGRHGILCLSPMAG